MQKKIDALGSLLGCFFLISSMAKALNAGSFSNIISQYELGYLFELSPLIIITEALIGILLIVKIHQKHVSFIAAIVVFIFTLVYAYGFWGKGVTDCGCFGNISFLRTSPLVTFIRNIILISLLFLVWRYDQNETKNVKKSTYYFLICFVGIITFMSGYTLKTERNRWEYPNIILNESGLQKYMQTSRDSSYMAFLFSYTCPHCLNSIANLNSYLTFETVNHIVALGVGDSIKEARFKNYFSPEIQIKTLTQMELSPLTKQYPTLYYIQNDTIAFEYIGELPCAYIMDGLIKNKKSTGQ